jgi:hypothetical protein
MSITYSECVSVASVMQHAKRMRRVILKSVACPVVTSFTLSHKQKDYRGKKCTEYKVCVLIFFYKFCLKHFSIQKQFSEVLS